MCPRQYMVGVHKDESFKSCPKSSILRDITPCSPVKAGAQLAAGCMLVFLHGLLFGTEDEGKIFLRNVR